MIKNDIKNIKIHPHNHFRKYKKFDSEFTEYVYLYYSVKYGSFTSTNYEFMQLYLLFDSYLYVSTNFEYTRILLPNTRICKQL